MTDTRRAFIGRVGAVLGGAPLAAFATGCVTAVVHRVRPDNGQLRIDLQSIPDLQADGDGVAMVQVEGADAPLFVIRQDATTFLTMSSVCTHRGCTVEAKHDRFVCPCHGSTYSRTGYVTKGPAERPLTQYRTALMPNGRTLVIDYRREA